MEKQPLSEAERIQYIIRILCNGNQAEFSRQVGIGPGVINKLYKSSEKTRKLNGVYLSETYIGRICKAYPQVNPNFLRDGISDSGLIDPEEERRLYEEKLAEAKKLIEELREELATQRKVINKLLGNA